MKRVGWGLKSLDKKICDAEEDIENLQTRQKNQKNSIKNLMEEQELQDGRLDELEGSGEVWEGRLDVLECFFPSQCFTYNVFTDRKRLTTYSSTAKRFCDTTDIDRYNDKTYNTDSEWKGDGWYRFQLPGAAKGFSRMPEMTEVPDVLKCGTGFTGYMADTHPRKYSFETKDVKYCFRGPRSNNKKNCPFATMGEVTNCGSFYVYHLFDVAEKGHPNFNRCNLGYCGTNDPLPVLPVWIG